ncbi:hypothetical protein BS78_10G226700 [Paspalum vaginatum]|nr:hypothetical protein BS78_10G226700 [Paspalum vaginatum]KAJ1260371.1 hypothetical protein BS78_10G226700 [Paspalum vaginatum]
MKGMPADLRKGMKAVQGMHDYPAPPVQEIIDGNEEQEQPLIIPADHKRAQPQIVEGGPVSASRFADAMVENTRLKKWQMHWFFLIASVMIVTNHVFPGGCNPAAVPGKNLITPALANLPSS